MSDEKRQTRLLPFRLRRAGAARFGAEEFAADDGAEDFPADAELTALLRAWEAPPQPPDARARLLADFRAGARRAPLWRRALAAELRIPLPVAACAALAFVASLFALGARGWTHAAPAVSKAEAAPEVRIVEVPVIRERVVTHTVYVEKKEKEPARGGPARVSPPQVPAPTQAPSRPVPVPRESLAQGAAREEAGAQPAGQDSNAGYFTRVNMEDFQPANEVNFRIVKRGGTDER